MVKLVPVKFQDGATVYLESSGQDRTSEGPSIEEVGCLDDIKGSIGHIIRPSTTAQQLTNSIKVFCENTINSFHELGEDAKPTKATVEFGLNISLEGDVYVVKSSSEASIKITAEWSLNSGDGNE